MGIKEKLKIFGKDTSVKKAIRGTFDSWRNVIKGIRTNRDSPTNYCFDRQVFGHSQLDNIYAGDPMAAKIIDLLPNSMTKEKIELQHDKAEEYQAEYKRLNLFNNMNLALKAKTVHGGAVIVLKLDDGAEDLREPVIPEKVKGIISASLMLDRWEIFPIRDNRYKEIELYTLPVDLPDGSSNVIHKDRLLIFDGPDTGRRNRDRDNGWGVSDLARWYNAIQSYTVGNERILTILDEYIYPVFKLDQLNEKLLDDCEGQIITKLETMMLVKGILNALVLDKEDEFEQRTINLSGLDKLMSETKDYLTAVTGAPHTLVLGNSPGASLGESGNSQRKDWADKVRGNQELLMTPNIDKINLYLKPTLGIPIDEPVPFEYKDLLHPSQKEQAEIRKLIADADSTNIDQGVYSGLEARSRYDDGAINMNIRLDDNAIIEMETAVEELEL